LVSNNGEVLVTDGGRFQDEVPRFRIRAVSVDGLESDCMLSSTINISPVKYIVNNDAQPVRDKSDNKMVNKRGGL
jgi:hypothetical protein